MPADPSAGLLAQLAKHEYPIAEESWGEFWDRLDAKELENGEALAVTCSLTTLTPEPGSVSAMLASLRARNEGPSKPTEPTVNIVGTGGGPSTFNLSTASAIVAAALGARVIKTGSRAYASRTGSIDMLNRLGIPLAGSYAEIEEMLGEFGIACCGPFVYPKQLARLARQILPFDMKTVGRFFNLVGPFLAQIPVTMQITGVSDHSALPMFREISAQDPDKRIWVAWNELGADELLSVVPSQVYDSEVGEEMTITPSELGLREAPFEDLAPVDDLDATVDHVRALISGDGPPGAIDSIKLNAGALALAAGVVDGWPAALELAGDTMTAGEPVRLIERLRAHRDAGK